MDVTLSLTAKQHEMLQRHLLSADGNEAAAILLCGRRAGVHRHRILAQKIYLIPDASCTERSPVSIAWPTEIMEPWLQEADRFGLSVVKVHSHPGGYLAFSPQDDCSDRDLFPCVDGWITADVPHLGTIMLPDGRMFGRTVTSQGDFEPLRLITVVETICISGARMTLAMNPRPRYLNLQTAMQRPSARAPREPCESSQSRLSVVRAPGALPSPNWHISA